MSLKTATIGAGISALIGFTFAPFFASAAGFGIVPPYLTNDSLTRNSSYEQKIILVREEAADDLNVVVTVNVPDANDWITVEPGKEFIMPSGNSQFTIALKVKVPENAAFGRYKGNARVVVSPKTGPTAGTVGITLGAQIDVDLTVIDKEIIDFKVSGVRVEDLEEGYKWWFLKVPGKMKFSMKIENEGNVEVAPERVEFDLYDSGRLKILEKTVNRGELSGVKPFEMAWVNAQIPTYLKAGAYKGAYRIYKTKSEVASQGELDISILPRGTLSNYEGYGLLGANRKDILLFCLIILGGLIVLVSIIIFIVKKSSHRPPKPPGR
jgi:hypothetical protein